MMAQSNVMREPSMEEILASIRRIIENNDQPEVSSAGSPVPDMLEAANDIHLTVDEEITHFEAPDFVNEIPAIPAVEPPVERVQPEPFSVQPDAAANLSRPMSLADVAARVKAASDRRVVPESTSGWMPEGIKPVEHKDVIIEPVAAQPAPEPEPDYVREPQAAIAEEAASSSTSIVSQHISDRVARSFDELVKALGTSTRSLDEIASEMLRPMLQEWLDDNLPTLVERLVREEIERVARGPRR